MTRERSVRHAVRTAERARSRADRCAGWRAGRAVALVCAVLLGAAPDRATAAAAATDLAIVEAAAPCCTDPSRFAFRPLPERGDVDFTIDRGSPVFEFQSGKSFFQAFRLPAAGGPYTLELRSFLENPESPRTARVFFPVIAILTDDFLVSRATDLDALRFDLPMLERTSAPAYRVELPVDPANTRERYLVVFTPAQLLAARGVQVTTPASAAQAARSAYLGASAFGRFRITLRPPADTAGEGAEPGAEPPAATPPAASGALR